MDAPNFAVYDQSDETVLSRNKAFSICALCSFGNMLFLGTREGYIMQLVFEEVEDQKTCYSFSVVFSRRISETAIILLQASQYTELVAALSGRKLRFFDAEKLECSNLRSVLDGVSTFSIVDSSLSTERHSIVLLATVIYLFSSLSRCLDSYAIVATSNKYFGVNLKTKTCDEIFDCSGSRVQPLIEPVSKDEFLLSGPGSLGVFVDTNGQSRRPPLTLSTNLFALFHRKQLVFAVDDEFVSIHCANQQKQIQTLIVENVCAACMSLSRNMVFVVSQDTTSGARMRVIRPETWDLEAKRLILAGCLSDASDLIHKEYAKLAELCSHRPATSSGAKNIFTARSKRVYTLMGLYLFTTGQLTQSRKFFEKSSLDIRELLCRYVDLLPRDYAYIADPNLNITAAAKASSSTWAGEPLSNIFDLSENLGISVNEFRKFLLDFLLENRRGRIFSKHAQLVETAILKLCVHLAENSPFIRGWGYESWEELVNSLSNVDVEDLLIFLEGHHAYHVKALLYRWNGSVEAAFDIWRSLALEVLTDVHFPGPDFFTDALFTTLTSPDACKCHVFSFIDHHGESGGVNSESALTGSTVYVELVARHLQDLLSVGGERAAELADCLLQRLACITKWDGAGASTNTANAKASTFVFAPTSLLKCLLPRYPSLAENFLWYRIFKAGDKESSRHTLLAELQMDLLLKYAEANDAERLERQRRRFRYTLSQLEDCQTGKLLEALKSSPSASLFAEEYVTLLGKLKKYNEALELLLLRKRDLDAALRFCAWCATLEARQKVAEQSVLWCHQDKNASKASSQVPLTPHVYTVLIQLLLCSSDKLLLEQSKKLLERDIPNLDFVEICKALPEDWPLTNTASAFLTRALKSTLTRVSASNMELGLAARLASASQTEAVASISHGLPVTEASLCACCQLPLSAYGSHRPFAWILAPDHSPFSVVHLHCLQADSKL
uniref:Transforming growth factor beta n=1 Tax=Echinococcus granulosus TaxID=6210 RepID=A0A068WJ70_ECHGR|nr:transforming growth factor beta [Echinococcus granulosus]